METTISLIVLSIILLVIVARGCCEYFINMPKWFANPPASFEVIRQQAKGSARFWIPVQIIFLISFFTALISNEIGQQQPCPTIGKIYGTNEHGIMGFGLLHQ